MGNPLDQPSADKGVSLAVAAEEEELELGDEDGVMFMSECIHCGRNGETSLEMKALPGFTDSCMVMAFRCPFCGFKNEEVQFAGQYRPEGVRYRLKVPSGGGATLARPLLKSEVATVEIPEMEFEIPGSLVDCRHLTKGDLTTVESLLRNTVANLRLNQAERAPDVAEKIEDCIQELLRCANGEQAFTLTMDDPSGNSYIALLGFDDSELEVDFYQRTPQQRAGLGLDDQQPPGH